MRRKRKLRRAFGLSVLSALSLMAVFAVSAHATADAGEFQIEGKAVGALLATLTGVAESVILEKVIDNPTVLLVPGRSLSISCAAGKVNNGALESTTLAKAEVTFSGCEPFAHPGGSALTACTVGKVKGVPESIVAKADILPFLHLDDVKVEPTKLYVTAEPETVGGNFTEVILSGSLCAIKGTYPVTGSISAQVTTNGAVVNLIRASTAFSELVKDTLKFGAFAASLLAEATIELTGTHKGMKFGVV